jgi:hypothetical protein
MTKAELNPNNWYVIHKEGGLITSFKRKPNGNPQPYLSYKPALNAMKKLGGNDGWESGWFVTTTVALARAKWGNV